MSPQQSIAHYRIVSKLGEGGMGAVYRATDTKLGREVAIKVLPAAFAGDPDRMARFQREAQVLASLNHPNIAAIYGVEERALVMELVEGPTLAERIGQGAIPLEEALAIAKQIADALEYAHERGVVHRDLKPANIKVTPEGRVKVLDFGLAKAVSGETVATDPTTSPTLTMRATGMGVILGTAAYMSPEQAKGKSVDKRADIWAFGVVLAEMLTGRQLYHGETISDVMAAVLLKEPDLERLPGNTPAPVRHMLRRCLTKDSNQRLRDIGEARIAIDECHANPAIAESEATQRKAAKKPAAWMVTSGALAITAAALAVVHFRERPAELPVVRFTIGQPEGMAFGHTFGLVSGFAVSPDGRRIAYIAHAAGGKDQLWVRPLDTYAAQPLSGTEGASYPFWSPDGRSIGFAADGKLKRIDAGGGPALTLANASEFRGGTWSPEGVIVFSENQSNSFLQRVSASGGSTRAVTTLDRAKGELSHRFPSFLPDGRHFLFSVLTPSASHTTIRAGSLDSTGSKLVAEADSNALYAGGYLLYLRESTLMAQPFDVDRLATAGDAVPLAEKVSHIYGVGGQFGIFSACGNGVLAYLFGGTGTVGLISLDRDGRRLATIGDPGLIGRVHLSPDGKSAAIGANIAGNQDIWIYDLERRLPRRFTFDPAQEQEGIWSPDSRTIAFSSNRKGRYDLYRKSADGTGAEELLYSNDLIKVPSSWSSDGRFLLFSENDYQTYSDIWVLPMTGGAPGKPYPWLKTEFSELNAVFSPDGKWVAYQSNESQHLEIYIAPFAGPGGKRQVSAGGGTTPRWRGDGREIYYLGPDNRLMAAPVSANGATVDIGEARALFSVPATGVGVPYDVFRDGQHFLAVLPPETNANEAINVVQNWAAGLKK